jgi:hypothetical protein
MFYLVDHDRKIIMGWSAKCGCTHVKYLFRYLTTGQTDHTDIHAQRCEPLPRDIETYIVVMVMRNPFERLVSGFLDKYKKGGTLRHKWPFPKLTFRNFVQHVVQRRFDIIDHDHFAPQTERFDPNVFNAKACTIFDVARINYQYLETIFKRPLPPEVVAFKGDHTRTQQKPWKGGPVCDLDMDVYFHNKVDVNLFYNQTLTRQVQSVFKNDFRLYQATCR